MSQQAGASLPTATPVTATAAGARRTIDIDDRADVGRRWTTADVRRLRRERPDWLTAARRRHAVAQRRRAAQRSTKWAAMLDAGGFTRPDDGSDAMIRYADEADLYLLMVTNVAEAQAQRAVHPRWPSVADDGFEDDEFR